MRDRTREKGMTSKDRSLISWYQSVSSSIAISGNDPVFYWTESFVGPDIRLEYRSGSLASALLSEGDALGDRAPLFRGIPARLECDFTGTVEGAIATPFLLDDFSTLLDKEDVSPSECAVKSRVVRETAPDASDRSLPGVDEMLWRLDDMGFCVPAYGVDFTLDEVTAFYRNGCNVLNESLYEVAGLAVGLQKGAHRSKVVQNGVSPDIVLRFGTEGS